MADYTVQTDLDPETLTTVVADAYRQWLEFALGKGSLGGKTLEHPSGRYAASISWKRTGVASVYLFADASKAREADWIEDGHGAVDLKESMLGDGPSYTDRQGRKHGHGNIKNDSDGFQSRVIPITPDRDPPAFNLAEIQSNPMGESIPNGVKRMWIWDGKPAAFRTMSNKPGSKPWIIPPMPAYSPAAILADLIGRAAALTKAG